MNLPAWLTAEVDGALAPHQSGDQQRFRAVIVVECEPVETMGDDDHADDAVRASGAALMGRWLCAAMAALCANEGLSDARLAVIVVENNDRRLTFAVTGLPGGDVNVNATTIVDDVLAQAACDVINVDAPPLAPQPIRAIYR